MYLEEWSPLLFSYLSFVLLHPTLTMGGLTNRNYMVVVVVVVMVGSWWSSQFDHKGAHRCDEHTVSLILAILETPENQSN